ncbi:MAG: tyrosine-type recombinase/integrase [Clostridia bacterium]|nr:tyrosine-type recombinase/integrase [Clostridia bacterium]
MSEKYYIQRNDNNTIRLRELKSELPYFCSEFFVGVENQTTPLTRLNYAYDLRIFFHYLATHAPQFHGRQAKQISLMDLNMLTATEIENFMEYLSVYEFRGKTYRNNEKAKSRKLSTLRSFFSYFFKKEKLDKNITDKVDLPKLHEKQIVRLEVDEMVNLLDMAETGFALTPTQQAFHRHTESRDYAIITLLLGTGIRVSECVGLDVDDIDFTINGFKVIRKGGAHVVLYFSDEVAKALKAYLADRAEIKDLPPTERALFLSLQKKRISTRAVQNLVKKYSSLVTPLKNISPHKLRSTYGTNLYRETKDIYVVADVLGHKDINTTKRHYAAMTEDVRRDAANKVKLREEI